MRTRTATSIRSTRTTTGIGSPPGPRLATTIRRTPESTDDIDLDGVPDHLDLDTDDDGVPDGVDAFIDTNHDGIDNVEDPDDDGDLLATALENAVAVEGAPAADADADGIANYLDERLGRRRVRRRPADGRLLGRGLGREARLRRRGRVRAGSRHERGYRGHRGRSGAHVAAAREPPLPRASVLFSSGWPPASGSVGAANQGVE